MAAARVSRSLLAALIALVLCVGVAPRIASAQQLPGESADRLSGPGAPDEEVVRVSLPAIARGALAGMIIADGGSNDGSSTLVKVATANAASTALAETGRVLTDLAFVADGTLYGITFTNLYRIDPTTGATSAVGTGLGFSNVNALIGFGNALYGASTTGDFLQISTTTGRATRIGTFGSGLGSSGDLAFSPAGVLYATVVGAPNDFLAIINPVNGRATLVGSIGFPAVYGLSFDAAGGLFGSAESMSRTPLLIRIDPVTGAGRAVGRVADAVGAVGMTFGAAGLTPPTNLTQSVCGGSINLSWSAPSSAPAPTSYLLEAGSGFGQANLGTFDTGSPATSFSATGVGAGTYFVRVRSAVGVSVSGPSNEVALAVSGGNCSPTVPGPPSNLSGTAFLSTVLLTWAAPTSGGVVSTYVIEVGSTPGSANLANVATGSTATSLSAPGVPRGTYFIRIRAQNASGLSASSNEIAVTVF